MTSKKKCDTSSAIVRAVCARVCAGRRYDLLLRKKRCWLGLLFLSNNPVAPWSRFTVAWDHIIFGGHIVYHTSPFSFSMRSYPPELQRQSTTLGPTNEGGGGEATISHPQCVMGLLALLLGWLAHCVISLVVCHMTSWRSMDFPMRHCMKVYGLLLRL